MYLRVEIFPSHDLFIAFQDEACTVAFMPGRICYTVHCYSEELCQSIPANPSQAANGSVQISHIVRGGGKGDDVDEFRTKFGINKNRCKFFSIRILFFNEFT